MNPNKKTDSELSHLRWISIQFFVVLSVVELTRNHFLKKDYQSIIYMKRLAEKYMEIANIARS